MTQMVEIEKSATRAADAPPQAAKRQYLRFVGYQLDPSFRKLDANVRLQAKEEALSACDMFHDKMMVTAYSLLATRSDADLMLWQIADDVDIFENFAAKLVHTGIGPFLKATQSLTAVARNYSYALKMTMEQMKDGTWIEPGQYRFGFVYSMPKIREWYQIAQSERHQMIEQQLALSKTSNALKIHWLNLLGRGEEDMAVIVEADRLEDVSLFLQQLRESKPGTYTLWEAPLFGGSCRDLKWILDALG